MENFNERIYWLKKKSQAKRPKQEVIQANEKDTEKLTVFDQQKDDSVIWYGRSKL